MRSRNFYIPSCSHWSQGWASEGDWTFLGRVASSHSSQSNGSLGGDWTFKLYPPCPIQANARGVDCNNQTCFHRGQLWISWEEGMKVFDELLLDTDWSVNAGTWMWLSCSSFFQQFFHLYCPVEFGRRADPGGDYIRWVVEKEKYLQFFLCWWFFFIFFENFPSWDCIVGTIRW